MSPYTFTSAIIICCALILEQSSVNGKLHQPTLDVLINNVDEVIVIGETVHLHCSNSTKAHRFFLTKHGQKNVTREQDNSMFTITDVRVEDTGTYTCKYSWDTEMSEASDPEDIFVRENFPPPKISAEPQNIVRPGEDITIKCSASYSNISFTLYKGYSVVKEGTEDEFSYIIRNAKEKDVGQYRCTYRTKPDYKPQIQSTFSDALMIQIRELARPVVSWTYDPNNSTQLNISCSAPEKHKRIWFQLLNASKEIEEEIKDIKENHVTFTIENPDHNQNIYFCIYRIKMGSHFADSIISDPVIIWGVHEDVVNTGTIIRHILSFVILIIMGVLIVKHVNTFQVPKRNPPVPPSRNKLALDSDYTETPLDQEEPTCSSDTIKESA